MATAVKEATQIEVAPEGPPARPQRVSKMAQIFGEARSAKIGTWFKITSPYKLTSATQYASDIRNAHKRPVERRVNGVLEGEVWDARHGEVDGEFYLWISRTKAAPRKASK